MTPISARIDARMAQANSGHPFLVVDGAVTDQSAMVDRIRRTFSVFADKGLKPGDRLAILSHNVLDVVTLMLAGIRYGLGVVNLNPEISAQDGAIALAACRPAHLVADRAILDRVVTPAGLALTVIEASQVQQRPGGTFGFLRRRGAEQAATGLATDLARAALGAAPAVPPADATAMMLFTSGTTSAPKVVELTHANLSAQIDAFLQVYDYDAESRILNPLPLHFTDGMLHGPIIALLTGATLYRPEAFDFQQIEYLLRGIRRDRITHFIAVPALLSLLDRLGDAFKDAFTGSDFRYIRSSGDLLPESLWRSVQTRFSVRVANTYGMSETVCEATYAGPAAETLKVGTIGRPVGCEIRIRSGDGRDAPPGETGELQIRGPIVMKGYLGQPELTARAFDGGWLRTGDLAVADPDEFVRIVGRMKSLIISGGVNIQPQDVSDALLAHPEVAEAVTLGLPHELWGEQVVSAVVSRDGANLSSQELIAHCAERLSAHKVPRLVTIFPDLPRNSAGKVLLDDLRARIQQLDALTAPVSGDDVEGAVLSIAAKVFALPRDSVSLTSTPDGTPGWDSLAHLKLVMSIEEQFGFRLSASEVLRIGKLSDVVDVVHRQRGKASGGITATSSHAQG